MGKKLSQDAESTAGDHLRRGRPQGTDIRNVIVIGSSAGGHRALRQVISDLSDDIPAAVIIMQHAPLDELQTRPFRLEKWLGESTRMPIVSIQPRERLRSGRIYIAPPGMAVTLQGGMLRIATPQQGTARKTIDTLFESAAKEFGDRVIAVILTGLSNDGTEGLKAVHETGGLTIVQDPAEAEYPQMPSNAMKGVRVTFCLNLPDVGATLDLLARRNANLETGLAVSIRTLKERVALLVRLIEQSKDNPGTHQFLSAEMIALELDLRSIQQLMEKALGEKMRQGQNPTEIQTKGRVP
ncbi:MAG TPA: chemotaxis protein CheB [Nitrospiraceae bacterium]|jgi:two-component system chemotaxis response regulator CheB